MPTGRPTIPAEAGRYHLYVSLACPWAHRTIIVRALKGLEEAISLSVVDPLRDEKGWRFGPDFPDPLEHGWSYLSEAYEGDEPRFRRARDGADPLGYKDRVAWSTTSPRTSS